jgi:hypothetical protein
MQQREPFAIMLLFGNGRRIHYESQVMGKVFPGLRRVSGIEEANHLRRVVEDFILMADGIERR